MWIWKGRERLSDVPDIFCIEFLCEFNISNISYRYFLNVASNKVKLVVCFIADPSEPITHKKKVEKHEKLKLILEFMFVYKGKPSKPL